MLNDQELYALAEAHLVFEESCSIVDEAQVRRLAELLIKAQGKAIEKLRQAALKIPRPWLDGGITFDEWVKAVDEFKV